MPRKKAAKNLVNVAVVAAIRGPLTYSVPQSVEVRARPVSRFEKLGNVNLVTQTHWYSVELEEWLAYMEELGFVRQPDERKELTLPRSSEQLLSPAEGPERRLGPDSERGRAHVVL